MPEKDPVSKRIVALESMLGVHDKLLVSLENGIESKVTDSNVRFMYLLQALRYEKSIILLGGNLSNQLQKKLKSVVFDYLESPLYEIDKSAYGQVYKDIPYEYEIERWANAVIERDGLSNPLFDVPHLPEIS